MGNGRRNSLRADTLLDCDRWSPFINANAQRRHEHNLSGCFGEPRKLSGIDQAPRAQGVVTQPRPIAEDASAEAGCCKVTLSSYPVYRGRFVCSSKSTPRRYAANGEEASRIDNSARNATRGFKSLLTCC